MPVFLRPPAFLMVACLLLAGQGRLAATDHAALYERFAPAVVGITCQGMIRGRQVGYFGTGVVVSQAGLVLSSTTVVPADAREIEITFTDGRIIPASLVASDAVSEAALLELAELPAGLVHMPLADSAGCAVGDPVYTWGNPYWTIQRDGGVSLSVGRISGLVRIASRDDQSRYRGLMIETDAAVNPGSDGGPLTDRAGHLLGLQSLAYSERRWLGLAVPTASMRAALPRLAALPVHEAAGLGERDRQLVRTAHAAGEAVVGIWVERRGDSLQAPEDRRTVEPVERPTISRAQRTLAERMIPEGCCTGFVVANDDDEGALVVTSAWNVSARKGLTRSQRRADRKKKGHGRVERIWVYAADGQRRAAELLGKDETRDIAVLRVPGLPAATPVLAPAGELPGDLRIGQGLALLGRAEAPGDLTVNIGVLSALQRYRHRFLQISALLNYGNTGGPVIDADGRLLGMACKLWPGSNWRQNCGVGFCLKADELAEVVPVLAAGEQPPPLERPAIGVRLDHAAEVTGALIEAVTADSPAAAAGLQNGDLIVGIDDVPIDDFISLANHIVQHEVGDRIRLRVRRGDRELELTVVIGSHSEAWATAGGSDDEEAEDAGPAAGGDPDDDQEDQP